tara:strand:- start:195 stop:860 length:666 start_codon:yes stop_codon:yes gene_type:complete
MKYYRTVWEGAARFTSLSTGQEEQKKEKVVIVQGFDAKGLMHGSFKVAYVNCEEGSVGLKLALTNRMPEQRRDAPWSETDDGPFRLYTTADKNAENDRTVGDLDTPFLTPTQGQIKIWTLKPFQPYQTWSYEDYWGWPVASVFTPPLSEMLAQNVLGGRTFTGIGIHINGWGHVQGDTLVRTMLYSAGKGADARKLYMKSSVLKMARQDIQEGRCFENFVD